LESESLHRVEHAGCYQEFPWVYQKSSLQQEGKAGVTSLGGTFPNLCANTRLGDLGDTGLTRG